MSGWGFDPDTAARVREHLVASLADVALLLGGSLDSWTGDFLRLVGKSDPEHRAKLRTACPDHVDLYVWWQWHASRDSVPTYGQAIDELERIRLGIAAAAPAPEPLPHVTELVEALTIAQQGPGYGIDSMLGALRAVRAGLTQWVLVGGPDGAPGLATAYVQTWVLWQRCALLIDLLRRQAEEADVLGYLVEAFPASSDLIESAVGATPGDLPPDPAHE